MDYCTTCRKPLVLTSEYDNPDVAAGHRLYQCEDHPNVGELLQWYCPYIPQIMIENDHG